MCSNVTNDCALFSGEPSLCLSVEESEKGDILDKDNLAPIIAGAVAGSLLFLCVCLAVGLVFILIRKRSKKKERNVKELEMQGKPQQGATLNNFPTGVTMVPPPDRQDTYHRFSVNSAASSVYEFHWTVSL